MLASTPRDPIVLVPGLLGLDRVQVGPLTLARYFPGIEESLSVAGFPVATARPSLTAGIECRANELADFVRVRFPNDRVHIIGHSMGGLDARFAISRLGLSDYVQSLTTIGTPHRGSSFADWIVRNFSRLLWPLIRYLGISTDGFRDLTTENCTRFNEEVQDAPGVAYYSVAGQCDVDSLIPLWRPAANVVWDKEGPNDGIVAVQSAIYGSESTIWVGDHMHLVNRPNPRATGWGHRPTDYLRLAERATANSEERVSRDT